MKTTKGLYIFAALICFLSAIGLGIFILYLVFWLNKPTDWLWLGIIVAVLGGCGWGAIEEVRDIEEDKLKAERAEISTYDPFQEPD